MSYYHCGNGYHAPACTGYKGALDDYVCLCKCHGEWQEDGRRAAAPTENRDEER